MPLVPLAQDSLEVACSISKSRLPACPFCGRHSPLMASAINHEASGGRTLYQSRISCTNYICSASVLCNERTREAAQQGAISRWSKRTASVET